MNPSIRSRLRSWLAFPALFGLLLLVPTPSPAEYLDLHVDPTATTLRLYSGSFDLVLAPGLTAYLPIQTQAGIAGTSPGTLPSGNTSDGHETSLFGLVLAEVDAVPSQLDLSSTATIFSFISSGTWSPAAGGAAGAASANAGFRVEDPVLGIDMLGALRGVRGSLRSTLVLAPDGPDAWTATGSLELILTGGTLDYASPMPGLTGSGPLLTGTPPIGSATITNARWELVSPGLHRLLLPFRTDPFVIFSDQIGGAIPAELTATLEGTLVAYSQAVPEPGVATGLSIGAGAIAWLGGRRKGRSERSRARPTAHVSTFILLLLGVLSGLLPGCSRRNDECSIPGGGYSWSQSFAGNSQCGQVSIDVDGDAIPEAQDADCQVPVGDVAPGVLASATQGGPGGTVLAESSVILTHETTSVVCRHDLDAALPSGASSCTGSFRREVVVDIDATVGAGQLDGFFVTARTASLGPGAGDPLAAAVSVQCPGEVAQQVALDAEPRYFTVFHDGLGGATTKICEVHGSITQSSTDAAGETFHKLLVEIGTCPPADLCGDDRDCPGSCVQGQCSSGSAGSACETLDDCAASAPVCYVDNTCRAPGGVGTDCGVRRHCATGLVCESGLCADTPAISIDLARITPDLYATGGLRPRFTPDVDLAVVAETNAPMGLVAATTNPCNPTDVSNCTPTSAAPPVPPGATSWAVDLPDYSGGASGLAYHVDVSVSDTAGAPSATTSPVDFEVYPADAGWTLTCTRSYDDTTGDLTLSFDVGLPPPLTTANVYDARFWLFQRTDESGWGFDETDPIRTGFILPNPTWFTATDDGDYQLIYIATPDFTNYFQASLRLDTVGGLNDVCALLP